MELILGLLIPFLGTTLGASLVYLTKRKLDSRENSILLSFSAGIMLAASIWSLLIPGCDISVIWTCIGFLFGILFLSFVGRLNIKNQMAVAIALHNIPEGMAVGVGFLSVLIGYSNITLFACFIFSIGIALQNLPEGAIISLPLHNSGFSKNKAFLYGMLSGVLEPIFGFVTLSFVNFASILPFMFGFSAGCMMYVVLNELIPESKDYKYYIYFFSIGFILMMFLDVMFC